MPRTWGRNYQVKLGAGAHGFLLDVEQLEHRLALSVAPMAPAETALVWSVTRIAEAPLRVVALQSGVEAPRVIQFGAESATYESTAAVTNLTWRRESIAENTIQDSASTPVAGATTEVISQTLPAYGSGTANVGQFGLAGFGEPISIIINKLPLEKLESIEGIRILPAPHDGEFDPGGIVRTLPSFDGVAWKPGEGRWTEPGFAARVTLPAFASAIASAAPGDSVAAAASTRVTAAESLSVTHATHAPGSLESSPFAFAVVGAALGKVGATPWVLPQIDVSNATSGSESASLDESIASARASSGTTVAVAAITSSVWELAANVESAIAALADAGPRAELLASVDLSTAALDQALESVMNEVEHLGADLFAWMDDASVSTWARSAAALAALGIGGAIALRWRAKRMLDEQGDSESTTWLFHQLQSSTGEV